MLARTVGAEAAIVGGGFIGALRRPQRQFPIANQRCVRPLARTTFLTG